MRLLPPLDEEDARLHPSAYRWQCFCGDFERTLLLLPALIWKKKNAYEFAGKCVKGGEAFIVCEISNEPDCLLFLSDRVSGPNPASCAQFQTPQPQSYTFTWMTRGYISQKYATNTHKKMQTHLCTRKTASLQINKDSDHLTNRPIIDTGTSFVLRAADNGQAGSNFFFLHRILYFFC